MRELYIHNKLELIFDYLNLYITLLIFHNWNNVQMIYIYLWLVVTGTWILFSHILGIIISIDVHIFQRS